MLNEVSIAFDSRSLIFLDMLLALMLFGVALSLRLQDFLRIARAPKAPAVGLVAQFLLLPASCCLLCWSLQIDPWLALGLQLVCCCPSGNFSNMLTFLARGNVALSVSVTAASSLLATVLTPLNFAFYSQLNPQTRSLLQRVELDALQLLLLVFLVLALPLILGMWAGRRFPGLAGKVDKPLRRFSLVIFIAFVAMAFARNLDLFLAHYHLFAGLVIVQNALGLALGYGLAWALGLVERDRRAISIEVGIQNAALALVIVFSFFPKAGAMALAAAFWGVWHLVSGTLLALVWARRDPAPARVEAAHE